jgi:hypothetical protein
MILDKLPGKSRAHPLARENGDETAAAFVRHRQHEGERCSGQNHGLQGDVAISARAILLACMVPVLSA